jgi:hypothetical protein
MRNIPLLGIAGASTVAMATWMAATMLIVLPRKAAATPVFAQQTGLPCGQCHENPAGGGKLKEFGQKFHANGNKLPTNEIAERVTNHATTGASRRHAHLDLCVVPTLTLERLFASVVAEFAG